MRLLDILPLVQVLRSQWKSPEEIRRIQDRKLRRLVEHAYAHVPYYRRLFDAVRLKPGDIRGADDLRRIPVTSRRDYSRCPSDDIRAQNIDPKRCRTSRSSGATGTPLSILHRRRDLSITNFAFLRAYAAHGYKPWHRRIEFTGSRNIPKGRSWYEYLGLLRRRVLSDADEPARWIPALQAWKPHLIVGYVMMLRQLASAIRGDRVAGIAPAVIVSTSAVLEEASRQFLQSVFKVNVVDLYASEEARCIAWECARCRGYHVNADLLIVELLDNGEPVPLGREGEITITNLHSFAMPFIRYGQGDVGTLAVREPTCGRGLPLLERIHGRTDDFIMLAGGRKLSPRLFYYALWSVPGVAEFRLSQESLTAVRVEVVATSEFDTDSRELIFRNLRELLGPGVQIATSVADSIPRGPSEKFRSFVSLVDSGTAASCQPAPTSPTG